MVAFTEHGAVTAHGLGRKDEDRGCTARRINGHCPMHDGRLLADLSDGSFERGGEEIRSSARAEAHEPSAADGQQALEEPWASLLRDMGSYRQDGSDDLAGLGANGLGGRSVLVEEPKRVPDELVEAVAFFRRKLGQYPDLLADFEKGLAQTLASLGAERLDRD